jgi:hypothetical protein
MKVTRARFGSVSNNPFQISLQEKILKIFFFVIFNFLDTRPVAVLATLARTHEAIKADFSPSLEENSRRCE